MKGKKSRTISVRLWCFWRYNHSGFMLKIFSSLAGSLQTMIWQNGCFRHKKKTNIFPYKVRRTNEYSFMIISSSLNPFRVLLGIVFTDGTENVDVCRDSSTERGGNLNGNYFRENENKYPKRTWALSGRGSTKYPNMKMVCVWFRPVVTLLLFLSRNERIKVFFSPPRSMPMLATVTNWKLMTDVFVLS